MNHSSLIRAAVGAFTALALLAATYATGLRADGGTMRHTDPTEVVPLHLIAPDYRDSVAEVISGNSLYRQGAPDTFPCNRQIYLSLLNHPVVTLALWKDLSANAAHLKQTGPDRFEGNDGNGATATWDFVYRSPRLHVLHVQLDYVGPRGNTHISGRVVLIVHTDYFRKGVSEDWVRHTVEAYVKVDSRGWRTVAKTARPLLEKVLEDQVQEAGWFVSLMGRLVEMYPYWACQVAQTGPDIAPEVRKGFAKVVLQTKRPNANTGRPTLAENEQPAATR
jgi:hypothetical protein